MLAAQRLRNCHGIAGPLKPYEVRHTLLVSRRLPANPLIKVERTLFAVYGCGNRRHSMSSTAVARMRDLVGRRVCVIRVSDNQSASDRNQQCKTT